MWGYDDPIDLSPIDWTPPEITPFTPPPDYGFIGDPTGGYADWGGGAGGDTPLGSTPPDLSPLPPYSGTTVNMAGLQKLYDSDPSFASMIGQLAKALGLTDAKGALNLLPLLAAGGLIGGGINSSNATKEASAQLQQAAKDANDQAQALIGPARDAFNPFIINGTAANGELLALARAPGLAGNFAPVKSYGFTAPKGTVTLADLVKAK